MTPPQSSGGGVGAGEAAAVGARASTPRWVKVFIVTAAIFAVAFVAVFGV